MVICDDESDTNSYVRIIKKKRVILHRRSERYYLLMEKNASPLIGRGGVLFSKKIVKTYYLSAYIRS